MKYPIKSIFLPTEEKTLVLKIGDSLYFSEEGDKRFKSRSTGENHRGGKYQHTYVTVTPGVEATKKGDWYYDLVDKAIYECLGINDPRDGMVYTHDNGINKEATRKVIATSDPSLTENIDMVGTGSTYIFNIAQVSESFLKELISNPNGDFEVEYFADGDNLQYSEYGAYAPYKPKLNQDGTVILTSVDKIITLSLKEYEDTLRSTFKAGARRGYCQRSIMANIGATCKEQDEDSYIIEVLPK
jgi:hypothetical protein